MSRKHRSKSKPKGHVSKFIVGKALKNANRKIGIKMAAGCNGAAYRT